MSMKVVSLNSHDVCDRQEEEGSFLGFVVPFPVMRLKRKEDEK